MSEVGQYTHAADSALSPLTQDRVAQFRAELFDGKYLVPEAAAAIGKSVRTLERLIQRLGVPVYKTGCARRIKPDELRQAMEAEARRQIEERQRAMVPRPVGRPPRVAKAAPVRTAGRATKLAQAAASVNTHQK
jgi:excisionase family DNA binding protein